MQQDTQSDGLSGKCLVAMPDMSDPRFRGSVVFLCAHSSDGAMGLIVNKPAEDVTLAHLLEQLSLPITHVEQDHPLHFGGPVEPGRGFVLHSRDFVSKLSDMRVNELFSVTSTQDILEDVSRGEGPAHALFALGYAGWSGGQLEAEIAENGWLVAPADHELIFDLPDARKWAGALGKLGIDPSALASTGGRA